MPRNENTKTKKQKQQQQKKKKQINKQINNKKEKLIDPQSLRLHILNKESWGVEQSEKVTVLELFDKYSKSDSLVLHYSWKPHVSFSSFLLSYFFHSFLPYFSTKMTHKK